MIGQSCNGIQIDMQLAVAVVVYLLYLHKFALLPTSTEPSYRSPSLSAICGSIQERLMPAGHGGHRNCFESEWSIKHRVRHPDEQ